jgi:DnaK suppressor protein
VPLSEAQRRHLEELLKEERARAMRALNRSLAENSEDDEQDRAGDLTVVPFHAADLGTDTMQAELYASNDARISRELAEIDAALARLYKSPESFGISESTGTQIPFERLNAIPWARS